MMGLAAWVGARAAAAPKPTEGSQADSANRSAPQTGEDLKRHWEDAKRFLRHGAYEDAKRSLDAILAVTPDDPWAQAYHALCERRLQASRPFTQLTPEQFRSMQQQLHREDQAQRSTAARQKAIERSIRKEQDQWDRQLKAREQQAKREEQLKQREAKAQVVPHAREELPKVREEAAGPREDIVTPELEQATELAPPAASAPASVGELESVTEPAVPGEAEQGVSPSLVGRTLPPAGAMQINARQMSVSPDRKIAIADGDVEVMLDNTFITCDHATLFTDTKDVYAEGRVRI